MSGRTVLNEGQRYIDVPFFVNVHDKMYGNGEYHYGVKMKKRHHVNVNLQTSPLRVAYRLRVTMKLGRLEATVRNAKARYDAMTPEEKAEHDKAQRESFVRGMMPTGDPRLD